MKLAKIAVMMFLFLILYSVSPLTANANLLDRFKDIYDAPERLDELQQQYDENAALLESQLKAQQEQLEEAKQHAQDLLAKQEELRQSNESYRQQNEELLAQLEQGERDRQDLVHKAMLGVGVLLTAIIIYAVSVRIWRFMVWRRQGRDEQGAMVP